MDDCRKRPKQVETKDILNQNVCKNVDAFYNFITNYCKTTVKFCDHKKNKYENDFVKFDVVATGKKILYVSRKTITLCPATVLSFS